LKKLIKKINDIPTYKIMIVVAIILIITVGYDYLNTTSREEDCYIACEIIQKEAEYTQIKLPDGETKWIKIEDEEVSEDNKYVVLRVIRNFNRINQLKSQFIMDTAICNKK
jgi:hypothetical protein